MSTRVYTPRRVFRSVQEFAEFVGATTQGVYPYLIGTRDGWLLRPLTEASYRQWHRSVWGKEERRA